MNDTRNPFAAPEKQSRAGSKWAVVAWVIAVATTAGLVAALTLWSRERLAKEQELDGLRGELERSGGELAKALAVNETNKALIVSLTDSLIDLKREKDMVGRQAKSLEDEMRAQLESKDVAISKLQGKLTVTIVDRVMFDSGEAILKPDGAAVMQKIADLLAGHPELKIHVTGHTDNVPIRASAQSRFASNWELSAARALAAVHFLTEKAGVDPRRVGAVAYGEFRPIADNATAEGRAKNRRIAVTILPEELADADAAPVAGTAPVTDGVPLPVREAGEPEVGSGAKLKTEN